MDAKPLHGKVAIVTGAASPIGIGHAIALGLGAGRGARGSVRHQPGVAGAEPTGNAGHWRGRCALPMRVNITDPSDIERAVNHTISALGGLHILVNNAGINQRSEGYTTSDQTNDFWKLTPEQWNRVVAVNFSGPFYMSRAVVGHMLNQGWGRIISVTTSMDTMWRKHGTPYGPSKAGHEALVAAMAQELEGTGVTANVLVPGGATLTN